MFLVQSLTCTLIYMDTNSLRACPNITLCVVALEDLSTYKYMRKCSLPKHSVEKCRFMLYLHICTFSTLHF